MAAQERAPRPQRPELKQSLDAAIASYVADIIGNLQKDRQAIADPFELCRRADMAMVATLQIVAPVLPDPVRNQVESLISIQSEVYNAAIPSTPKPTQDLSREQHHDQAARYAEALRERFETQGMLAELQGYPNFVVWRYAVVDGQRKKPPFDPNTNLAASPTDSKTWGTLETALTAVASGRYQGIGFMLSNSPFSGIDLDHSVEEGTLLPWAKAIVDAMDTYGEYSPSWNKAAGTGGMHLLVEGKPPASKKSGNIEVYGEKHYLTLTTNHIPETPSTINSRQQALNALYSTITPLVGERGYQNTRGGGSGEPLTELPPETQRDEVLQRLLRGDITGYKSQSSADFAVQTRTALLERGFHLSMSRAGTPTDNGYAERFVGVFKLAVADRKRYRTLGELLRAAEAWINFYNQDRPHESLDYRSPNQYATECDLPTVPYLPLF